MKHILFLVITLLIASRGYCEPLNVQRIISIESSGNPHAYNKGSGAIGLMQITPIVLEEWNQHNKQVALITDLYTPYCNVQIGKWYLNRIENHYCKVWNIPPTIDNILIGYNYGISNLKNWYRAGANYKKLPRETRNYLKRYNK
jgi:soluble lytic murein transglycosylase-like protein